MMRILLCAVGVLLLPIAVRAEGNPAADITLGYSSMWVGKGYTFFLNGGRGSVALNANHWLGFVGDFGTHHADPGVSLTTQTYMFGPRFSYRKRDRFVPLGQILVRALHASAVTTGFTDVSNAQIVFRLLSSLENASFAGKGLAGAREFKRSKIRHQAPR